MNLTELLATPVVHLPTATYLGVVSAFGVDEEAKRISHVIVVDEDSYCHEVAYRWEDVRRGQDALLVDAPEAEDSPKRVPFRGAVLDTKGTSYGYLKDVAYTQTGRIKELYTTKDERISPTRMCMVGDVVLLHAKRRKKKVAPQETPAEGQQKDEPAPDTQPVQEEVPAAVASPQQAEPPQVETPTVAIRQETPPPDESGLRRIAGDYSFLLGRSVKSDLTLRGELLLAKGTTITPETVDMARQKGVLLPLTVLSR